MRGRVLFPILIGVTVNLYSFIPMRRARYRLKPVSLCLIAGFLALPLLVTPAGASGIDEPYPIGRVLTPETAARKDAPDVVRMQVSHFSQPNQNDAIIMPTSEAAISGSSCRIAFRIRITRKAPFLSCGKETGRTRV